MDDPRPDFPEFALDLLAHARTIAVVGLSPDAGRPSRRIAAYLRKHGYEVVGVNPNHAEVSGIACFPSLASIGRRIDIVDVFLRSERVPAVATEAVEASAGMLWLQEGVVSAEAESIAMGAGMPFVQDGCIMKAHIALRARGEKR